MKVLHVIPAIAACYGGPSRVVLDTCRALRQEGIEAEIATTNADGALNHPIPSDQPTLIDGVPVYFFERQWPWKYKFSWPLTRWLKHNVSRYDLLYIHAVFSYSTSAAAHYARKYRIPYVMLPHGMLGPWSVRQNRMVKQIYLKAIEARNLAQAAAVQFTAEEELRTSVACGTSNFVLPYLIDVEPISNEARGPLQSDTPRILFLSRIDRKKGLDVLLTALSRLAAEGRQFEFVIAGSGEAEYENEIRAMIRDLGLESPTSLKGFVQGAEKNSLLRSADMFVLPSHGENFGIAVVEAMACGVPVIISDQINLHDEVDKAGAGLIVSPTVDSLYHALRRLLDSPDLRSELGTRGRELVRQKFSPASITRSTLQVYQDVVNGSRECDSWRPEPRFV